MNRMIYKYTLSITLCLSCFYVFPQHRNSPYSLFGLGIVEQSGFGVNRGMGGVGFAIPSSSFLNNTNPASYVGIDSLSFLFEFGVYGKYSSHSTKANAYNQFDANINYLALGHRVTNWWMSSIGITPYSSMGYSIITMDPIEGSRDVIQKSFSGSGGINQVYWGNSIRLLRNLSVGINASYYFGNITHDESIINADYPDVYTVSKDLNLKSFDVDFGAQYFFNIGGQWKYAIGLVYGNGKDFRTKNKTLFHSSYDTIPISNNNSADSYVLPRKIGAGLFVSPMRRFGFSADYEQRQWEGMSLSTPSLEVTQSQRLSLGFMIDPDRKLRYSFFQRLSYRGGFLYERSYITLNLTPIEKKALTLGLGIPYGQSLNRLNVAFELGVNGTYSKGLIMERYGLIHLNLTMHDKWFIRPKFK